MSAILNKPAHNQPLSQSALTTDLWSVCGPSEAQQDWWGANGGGERKVEQLEGEHCHIWYSREAVNLHVLSLWEQFRQALTRAHTCTHFNTFTHKLTCMQTCSHTTWRQVKCDSSGLEVIRRHEGRRRAGKVERKREEVSMKLNENFGLFQLLCGNVSSHTWQLFRAQTGVICLLPAVSYFYSLLRPEEVTETLATTQRGCSWERNSNR